ncbi:MAG: YbjN domain-containing protein [Pseudomonadota bacterium]
MSVDILQREEDIERLIHPVDLIEYVANLQEWNFERTGDDEIAVAHAGHWANYHISFAWMDSFQALHFACAFDVKANNKRVGELARLLASVNEQLLMGHFDYWEGESAVMYRHSLLLAGGAEITEEQIGMLHSNAIETCEAYYQAFQAVLWSGMKAEKALEFAMFETVGEA